MLKILVTFVPGLIGGVIGGYLGSLLVYWFRLQGMYTVILPGALTGLACGFLSINHSRVRGVLCGLLGLVAGVAAEYRYFRPPFEASGFLDFAAHFYKEPPVTLLMVGLGTFFGFWWGRETTNPWRKRFGSMTEKG